MKTLSNYSVEGALYVGDTGREAQVGDQVKIYLDVIAEPGFPAFILGAIQHPITKTPCLTHTIYSFEYNEDDLLVAPTLALENVVDVEVISCCEILSDQITTIQNDITTIEGDITTIEGDIENLTEVVNNIEGGGAALPFAATYAAGAGTLALLAGSYSTDLNDFTPVAATAAAVGAYAYAQVNQDVNGAFVSFAIVVSPMALDATVLDVGNTFVETSNILLAKVDADVLTQVRSGNLMLTTWDINGYPALWADTTGGNVP